MNGSRVLVEMPQIGRKAPLLLAQFYYFILLLDKLPTKRFHGRNFIRTILDVGMYVSIFSFDILFKLAKYKIDL